MELWDRWLEELYDLPAEAPEWDNVEAFLEAVQVLAEQKQAQRAESLQRQELEQVIAALRADLDDWIAYFRMEQCLAWTAVACPLESIQIAIPKLEQLRSLLEQYKGMDSRPRPATIQERRALHREMEQLEGEILTLYEGLNQYFSVVERAEEAGAKVGEAEEGEAEVEQVLAGPLEGLRAVDMELTAEKPSGDDMAVSIVGEPEAEPLEPEKEIEPHIAEGHPPVEEPTAAIEELVLAVADEEVNQQLVNQMAEGDLSVAYWLAWTLESQGKDAIVPSYLIAALQGSFWAASLWPQQLPGLLSDLSGIASSHQPARNEASKWMGVAAALYPALVDPGAGWGDWLNVQLDPFPALTELVGAVRAFMIRGWALQPEELEGIKGQEERDTTIQAIAEEARQWLQQAPSRCTTFQRASAVWARMVSSHEGDLHLWFRDVANDRRDRVEKVRIALEKWASAAWVDRQIQDIDRDLVGRKLTPIQGTARKQIIRWVTEACDMADRWSQAVLMEQRFAQQGNWLQGQTRELLENLTRALPEAREELRKEAGGHCTDTEKLTLGLLGRAIGNLETIFLSSPQEHGGTLYDPPGSYLRQHSLDESLAYRLFWFPEASLNDAGLPGGENVSALCMSLSDPTKRGRLPEEVLKGWLARQDYRFVPFILPKLEDPSVWEARYREALRSDVLRLQREMEETTVSIEQVVADGLIAEGERAAYTGDIEAVRKYVKRMAGEEAYFDVGALFRRLQAVRSKLEQMRGLRLRSQRQQWNELRGEVSRIGLEPEQVQHIVALVEDSLKRGNLRVVDEYLVHLREALKGGKTDRKHLDSLFHVQADDPLREFNEAAPNLLKLLADIQLPNIARMLREDKPLPDFPIRRLPAPRLEETYEALEAWRKLKGDRTGRHQENFPHLITLMRYLGFTIQFPSPITLVPLPMGRTNFQHWRIAASAEDFAPVHQFGSEREGHYDVIGVWARPGFDLIGSLLQQIGNQPTLLLYFGRLLPRQREDLLRLTHKKNLPVLVVDEVLLLFLAREYDVRLTPLFHCALPFAALNPYVPFVAGSVPPEMFVGRQRMEEQLLDPYGPAIVYGGRQLGKSALLRQVHRKFHQPHQGQYAILEDIKPLGDPRSGLDYERTFWHRFASALARFKLLDDRCVSMAPEQLQQYILQMMADPNRRLMLLLDEADSFLDADAKENFRIVSALKYLMDETQRRFKVIISGLHNVQRFQRISNQPLAHLGTPVEVGPLEPDAARELLERPLRALGYRFGQDPLNEDPSLVFHILSYTNYHPGLIQLFGYYLVEHLQGKYQHGQPPFPITRSDVEAVYLKDDVRKAIRDRFIWTLALDDRYEAIALAMILDQWEDLNGFDRLYTAKDIHERAAGWWPQGFGTDMLMDDRFPGFLDEMCGLGVLSRVVLSHKDGNYYRLRSPNVVQLIGTYDELWDRLDAISKKHPPTPLRMESHRALLDSLHYSPLSYAQEGILNAQRAGVGLVFGSDALGMTSLKEATQRFVLTKEAWQEIRVIARRGDALGQWLAKYLDRRKEHPQLVAYRVLQGNPEELEEQITAAVKFCKRYSKKIVRIIFALGPSAAWQWFQLPERLREAMEQEVDGVVSLKLWDSFGIRQRLEQHTPEMIASDRNCQRILEVTGGWPILLDALLSRCESDDPAPELERLQNELTDSQSSLRQRFFESLEIPDGIPLRLMQALLKEKGMVPQELVHLLLENEPLAMAEAAVEYLLRMAVLRRDVQRGMEPQISVDPVVARLWTDER